MKCQDCRKDKPRLLYYPFKMKSVTKPTRVCNDCYNLRVRESAMTRDWNP